jgi:hypothetical protein
MLGYLSHRAVALADGVLVVEDVALHLQIKAVAHLDHPALAQRGNQRLLECSQGFTVGSLDGHGVPDGRQPLLELTKLGVAHILKEEGIAHAQYLAVKFEGAPTFLILDPKIVTI